MSSAYVDTNVAQTNTSGIHPLAMLGAIVIRPPGSFTLFASTRFLRPRFMHFMRFMHIAHFAHRLAALCITTGVIACASYTPNASAAPRKLDAVASFSVLADIVSHIGGDRVQVHTLIARDQDPHTFEPTPHDVALVHNANVVFVHGVAGFEGYLPRLISASAFKGPVVTLSDGVKLRTRVKDGGLSDDPHTWNNPLNAIIYVRHIVATLEVLDPAGHDMYEANGRHYIDALVALNAHAHDVFDRIPPAQRTVITSHAAFGYLGDAYGITFLSPLGISTDTEPSAQKIGRLIEQIRREHVSAFFIENSNDPRFVEQIGKSTGARNGGVLYAEALSAPNGPASTYLDLLRHNIDTLAAAMQPATGMSTSANQPDECHIDVEGLPGKKFGPAHITVPSQCPQFTVQLMHMGDNPKMVAGHDWVLVRTADVDGAVRDGLAAGPDHDWVMPGDKRIIARTPLIGGGEHASVTFPVDRLKRGEAYTYYCSFPDHVMQMRGTLTLE